MLKFPRVGFVYFSLSCGVNPSVGASVVTTAVQHPQYLSVARCQRRFSAVAPSVVALWSPVLLCMNSGSCGGDYLYLTRSPGVRRN